MFGFSAIPAFPRPAELGVRALLAGVLVLVVLHYLQGDIIAPLVPALAKSVPLVDSDFTILSSTTERYASAPIVRIRADFAAPVRFAGRTLYPLSWSPGRRRGSFEVRLSLGGLLQYSGLMFIIAFAWPAKSGLEFVWRFALCLPLMAALLFIEVPVTVVAELWTLVRAEVAPDRFNGWLLWSRFLMGGGGLLMAGLCALAVVRTAGRVTMAGNYPA
jgi:hypothetical protein